MKYLRNITPMTILATFLILKLMLHLCLNGQWSFHRDELLYLALGRNMDWGYASVPAGIGFWAWFADRVLGGSVEAIRLVPTLLGTCTVLLTGLMALEMIPKHSKSGYFAMTLIGLAGIVCGAYLRPSMLFIPVVFDIFYWTLLCWLLLKYINSQKNGWLLWFGVAAGVGLLNKYTVLIYLFALIPGVVFSPLRSIFSKKSFYIAVALALLIISPNIAWQAARDFPVFQHMSELAESQFTHVSLSSFWGDQIRFFLPALPIWLCGLYFLLFQPVAARWRIFGLAFLMVIAVLLLFSAKSYYSLGAYPVLIAAGAAFLQGKIDNGARRLWVVVPAFMCITGLIIIPAALPLFAPEKEARFVKKLTMLPGLADITRWENGKHYALPQDFADMLGWEELAQATAEHWNTLPEKNTAAIYAEHYGLAGAIEHLGRKKGVSKVLSFSDNYRYWLPDTLRSDFSTLIYVNDELGDDMHGFFQDIQKVWELDMPLSRQHGTQIYLCKKPTPAFFERMNTAFDRAKRNLVID